MITYTESAHRKNLIAEGGEGKLYIYKKEYIIKIFKKNINLVEKYAKIKQLMQIKLPDSIIKPLDFVYDSERNFIGYLMKKVDGEDLSILASRKFIKMHNMTKKEILSILAKIEHDLKLLHSHNIYVGDLSDSNILFNGNLVYFIDVDSWSIGKYKCKVVNDSFKDPNLFQNQFNVGTDNYAFAILVYKCLTRIHPFGGILRSDQNISLRQRMEKGITVIDNRDIIIPKMVDKDLFMPLKFKSILKTIFTTTGRTAISMANFSAHLTLCPNHRDYFYSRFNKCPICDSDAHERRVFTKIGKVEGITIREIFRHPEVKILLTEYIYLTNKNIIKYRNSNRKVPFKSGIYYGVNFDGTIFWDISKNRIEMITPVKTFELDKKLNSPFKILGDAIYYISNNLSLVKFSLLDYETSSTIHIEKVSINAIFDIQSNENYFICNTYDHKKILNVAGYNYDFAISEKIAHHGIHYDPISEKWLFLIELSNGNFITSIIDKREGIIYLENTIKYIGNLDNICFHNGFIYKPSDGSIIRFNYKSDEYKEFKISDISTETKLIKKGQKFTAIDEKVIYEIG